MRTIILITLLATALVACGKGEPSIASESADPADQRKIASVQRHLDYLAKQASEPCNEHTHGYDLTCADAEGVLTSGFANDKHPEALKIRARYDELCGRLGDYWVQRCIDQAESTIAAGWGDGAPSLLVNACVYVRGTDSWSDAHFSSSEASTKLRARAKTVCGLDLHLAVAKSHLEHRTGAYHLPPRGIDRGARRRFVGHVSRYARSSLLEHRTNSTSIQAVTTRSGL